MKKIRFSALVLSCGLVCEAQTPSASVVDVSPRVGVIEVFGARKVPLHKILTALGTKPGDPLPPAEAAEDRINKVSGVLASRLEAVCCAGPYGGAPSSSRPSGRHRSRTTLPSEARNTLASIQMTFWSELNVKSRSMKVLMPVVSPSRFEILLLDRAEGEDPAAVLHPRPQRLALGAEDNS